MNQYENVMYNAFVDELEKTSSAKLMKAVHDAMGSGPTSKKSLAMLRKRGIIDAADDAAAVSSKARKYFRGLESDLAKSTARTAPNFPQRKGSQTHLDNMIREAMKDPVANRRKIRALKQQRRRQLKLNAGQGFRADPRARAQYARKNVLNEEIARKKFSREKLTGLENRQDSAKAARGIEEYKRESVRRFFADPKNYMFSDAPTPRSIPKSAPAVAPNPSVPRSAKPSTRGRAAPNPAPQKRGAGINPYLIGGGLAAGVAGGAYALSNRNNANANNTSASNRK